MNWFQVFVVEKLTKMLLMLVASNVIVTAMKLSRLVALGSVLLCSTACSSKKSSNQNSTGSAAGGSSAADLGSGASQAAGSAGTTPVAAVVTPAIPAGPLQPLTNDTAPVSGKPRWARAFGGLGTELPRDMAITDDDSSIVVGYFGGDSDLAARGGGDVKPDVRTSAGDSDVFVTKLANDGKQAWTLSFGGKTGDVATGVAVHGKQIVVVGNFSDKITVALPGASTEKAPTAQAFGADDMFALLLNENGEPQWLFAAGGADSDGANSVAATPDGGWIIGGSFAGKVTFGTTELVAAGRTDAFLLKLNAEGTVLWAKQFGGAYEDSISHVVVDVQGNLIVQGTFADEATWGGQKMHAGGGSDSDVLLAKYDSNGNHLWSKNFGNQFNEVAGGVAVDPAGNIVMTGSYDRSITFGDTEHGCAGESDVFVARFAPDGTVLWSKTFGGAREDIGFGIAVDASGAATVSGWFFGKMTISDKPNGDKTITGKGNKEFFLLKLDSTGALKWITSAGDRDHDQGRVVALTKSGSAVVAGVFRFALPITQPALQSARADGDKAPKPDVFIAAFDR